LSSSQPLTQALTHALTEAERVQYRERGFHVREALFREPELEALRAAAESVHDRICAAAPACRTTEQRIDGRRYLSVEGSLVKWEWGEAPDAIRSMEPVHPLSPVLDALIDDPRLCAPAAEWVGTAAVSLFTDKLNFKRPSGSPFPWHQDAPYWAFSCRHLERLASVQLYLDDANEQNGCLWVIPGSHRFGHLPAPRDRGVLGRLYTDVRRLQGLEPVAIAAPAGSAIFFHPYLVHGSRSNRSRASRRALVLTYQPPGLPVWNGDAARIPVAARTAPGARARA
jgi:phytanoyl-CoA hydroxylase